MLLWEVRCDFLIAATEQNKKQMVSERPEPQFRLPGFDEVQWALKYTGPERT